MKKSLPGKNQLEALNEVSLNNTENVYSSLNFVFCDEKINSKCVVEDTNLCLRS